MDKQNNVIKFYALCNRLKDLERTGWKDWNVERKRIESVAEHVFGVQMLAIAMKSEFEYDIDIFKVVSMLAVHELEEIYIGDLTLFDVSKEEKEKLGHVAVANLLDGLLDKEQIISLIHEFDARETFEAKFAFWCDKLECDLQSKIYDEECCVDLNNQENNKTFKDNTVQQLLKQESSWSNMWLEFGQRRYNYDENFKSVSDYAKENGVKKLTK